MSFKVVLTLQASDDLESYYRYAAQRAPVTASRWLDRFAMAIEKLSESPESWPLAHEAQRASRSLREMLFGKRPNVYRVIFEVDGNEVRVLRIRRGNRRWLTQRELGQLPPTE